MKPVAILYILVVGFGVRDLTAQAISFVRQDFGSQINPLGIAAADFNGDGNTDLAICDSSGVSILFGSGEGGFQPPLSVPGPPFLAIADFNFDGIPDVAAGGGSVLLGAGDGTFGDPLPFGISSPLAVGDFNGDGKPDLVVRSGTMLSVLLGQGNGMFEAQMDFPTGLQRVGARIVVSDFNGDGVDDIAVSGDLDPFQDGIAILLGQGDGTLAPPIIRDDTYGIDITPYMLLAGDFNHDGKTDLLAGYEGPDIEWGIAMFRGNGDGTLQDMEYAGWVTAESGVAADFDGDGNLDVAFVPAFQPRSRHETSGVLTILSGKGNGEFQEPVEVKVGTGPYSIALGDFDGDGKPDLAVGGTVSKVVTVLMNRSGTRALKLVSSASLSKPVALESLASLFGSQLATSTEVADPESPPTSLGGISVRVRDSADIEYLAPLLFVSPTQVNFQVPAGLAPGDVVLTVEGAVVPLPPISESFRNTAPGLFTLANNVVAAYVVRIEPDGEQTVLLATDGIVLDDRPVYLILYGTGIRNRSSLDNVRCTIGGIAVPAEYAGPQTQVDGLDQVNIRLVPALKGNRDGHLVLSVDGERSNTVFVDIQ